MAEELEERRPKPRRPRAVAVSEPVGEFYENTRWRLFSTAIWWLILILGILAVGFRGHQLSEEPFLGTDNLMALLEVMIVPALLVAPMVMIVAAGGLDLSVAAVATFTAFLLKWLLPGQATAQNALLIALGVAAGIGLLNGLLVVLTRANGALVTLGTLLALPGAMIVLERYGACTQNRADLDFIREFTLVSGASWAALGVLLVLGIVLMQFTPVGRRPRPEVARENESCLGRGFYKVLPYVLSGLAAGCVGVLLLAESPDAMSLGVPRKLCNLLGESAYTSVPNNLAALVILAAILGGAPFGGGFGSAVGGVLATILLVVASEVALLCGVYIPALALLGGLIVAAALLMRIYFGLYSVGFRGKAAE